MFRALRLFCLLSVPLGCTGSINDGTSSPGGPNPPNGPSGPNGPVTTGPAAQPGAGALDDKASVPAAQPVRRLTNSEYDNTLRDLLGITTSVSKNAQIGQDTESGNAGFLKGGAITGGDDARQLMEAGSQVGDAIAGKLGTLLPCSPLPTAAAEQDACVGKFITAFGKRAYRRPLTAKETELAKALYTTQRSPEVGATFEQAVVALVGAFIQAPQFLYHWELGSNAPVKDGNLIRYNSYEVASRLSYFFWSTMPDDKLFAAADADALKTPEQIALQARRLLSDDRAKQGLGDFHLQFLEIGPLTQAPKDDTIKAFNPAVAQSMMNETRDFVASIFLGAKATGSLSDLLTSSSTVIEPALAKLYGVTATGTAAQPVMLKATERAGLLTQLAYLTAHADTGDSNPVKRADAFMRRLFCMEFTPPPNVPMVADSMPGGDTTRQRFAIHSMNPCASCHTMLDPIGFSFEGYDTIGVVRTTENNKPIDTTGQVTLPWGDTVKFQNAVDLIGQIAKMPQVQDCITTQWLRYMTGRREVEGEKPSLQVVRDLFKKSNNDMRELLVGMTRTRSFTHRSPSAGEVLQ
jgi:Protein of unknown function (DUF1592)/Protein of unknown function (DUF1588)/Protein of unknown function (DUF1595)/Protein of unknown function (DUF1585)/Protein of unknown function (DUF1587)